jgi:DNA polymerase III subunit epsilon
MHDFTVLDTETTGFRNDDRVLELAFLRYSGGACVDSWVQRVNPERSIPEQASAIHGIYAADVADCPTIRDVAARLWTWLDDDVPLVAHNLTFDLRLLGQSFPVAEWPGLDRPGFCTLDAAKRGHPVLRRRPKGHKLIDLAEYFDIRFDASQAHGAKYDAEITARCVPYLAEHWQSAPLRAFLRDA